MNQKINQELENQSIFLYRKCINLKSVKNEIKNLNQLKIILENAVDFIKGLKPF
ncbi:hypothetical protein CLERM_339 [Coxiella-like endosymbiont]|nr:hypothetical protein CLERM_339 [Coxiella-like endosymbiont]